MWIFFIQKEFLLEAQQLNHGDIHLKTNDQGGLHKDPVVGIR